MIYAMNKGLMGSKKGKEKMTQYSISFAIGGLLGDVFFHTMPHMSSGGHSHDHGSEHNHHHGHEHGHHDHGHHHEHGSHGGHSHNPEEMLNNMIIIVGIIAFFLMERFTHSLLEHNHSHDGKEDNKHDHDK